jgi:hypothetical protein
VSQLPETEQAVEQDGLQYDRLCRTANSEAYLVSQGEQAVARIDLHFTPSVVYGVLVVERELPDEEIRDLIARIDEDLVWSANVTRDDFVVTAYQGREIGVFSDAEGDQDEDDELP